MIVLDSPGEWAIRVRAIEVLLYISFSHIEFAFTNSGDPDEMPHFAAFHLGLHCLLAKVPFLEFPVFKELKENRYGTYAYEIYNNLVCATSKGSDQPAHTRSLIRAFACRLNILQV